MATSDSLTQITSVVGFSDFSNLSQSPVSGASIPGKFIFDYFLKETANVVTPSQKNEHVISAYVIDKILYRLNTIIQADIKIAHYNHTKDGAV